MQNAAEELSIILRDKELLLTSAESCTGGMIAAAITGISGSSDIFDRGFVTYSNAAKQDLLGVSDATIEEHGAVSIECASEMAVGALKNSAADIAVSVTGIAGPTGGSQEKPIGLVYIAVCLRGKKPVVAQCDFTGDRTKVRVSSCNKALGLLINAASAV